MSTLASLPWEVYLALVLLASAAAVAVVLLIALFHRSVEDFDRNHVKLAGQPWLSREDDGEVHSIPLYPRPPEHITRWGIHAAHVKAGHDTQKGCPVCYTLELHMQPSKYIEPFTRGKED